MKKLLFICICVAISLTSCDNGKFEQYSFYFLNDNNQIEGDIKPIRAITDSDAVLQAYTSFFIELSGKYLYGKATGDTSSYNNITDFDIKNKNRISIKNNKFLQRDSLIKKLYKEIVLPQKNECLKTYTRKKLLKEKHERDIKSSIHITNYYLSSPNSAGGVDAYFYYKNLNDSPIKYLTWTGYPINNVGDAVSCTIRNYEYFSGKDTGPVKKNKIGGGCWSCAWYNSTAKKLILTSIDIEYMDGTTIHIQDEDLYQIGKKK